jgi:hypothetical protein
MCKKALIGVALVLMSVSSAFAVPVSCTTLSTLSEYIAQSAGGGCFVQDKLFTNFSYSGGGATVAADVAVDVVFSVVPSQDIHGFILSTPADGVWSTGFTFGYTIAVDPPNPAVNITGAELQINLGILANPTTVVSTKSNGLVQATAFGNLTDIDLFAGLQLLTSSTVVTIPTNGFLISLEEDYIQTLSSAPVSEPATMTLLGSGLLGMLAWLRLRRRRL